MPESRDPRSIIDAAEQAAAAGNYAAAEELLREAALLQEASLGPLHPDLANTLNNLGVVCERTDNPVDAEDCFRRAVAIAEAVLAPDHPFVATSQKNLRDFCEARGKLPLREPQLHAESQDLPPLMRRRFVRPLAIGALGPGVMLIVIFTTARPWVSSTEPTESSSAIAIDSSREIPAPPRAHLSVEPIPLPKGSTKTVGSGPEGASARRISAASTRARPTVVRARLCAELDQGLCDPADRPVPPGPLFFYTQVKSRSATTVTHRWYRGDRLYQSVELRVQASPSLGDRTHSRQTMNRESAGSWRVELRAEDGTLLHEERFSVR